MAYPTPEQLAELTDALARGRIFLAELAGITPQELEALLDCACTRLETGRIDESLALFAALVTLMPHSGRAWRCYGVALFTAGQLPSCIAAWEAALVLDPAHDGCHCHLGEALLALGDPRAAEHLRHAAQSAGFWRARAEILMGRLPIAAAPPPAATPQLILASENRAEFTLTDGRVLPLTASRFSSTPRAAPTREEAEAVTDRAVLADHDITDTAVIPRSLTAQRAATPPTGTITARVQRRAGWPTAVQRRRLGEPLSEEITHTDVKSP